MMDYQGANDIQGANSMIQVHDPRFHTPQINEGTWIYRSFLMSHLSRPKNESRGIFALMMHISSQNEKVYKH